MKNTHTICFDTLCTGYAPITDGDGNPVEYASQAEAIRELESDIDFYDDCFVCELDDIGHKTIFYGSK